MAVFIYKAKQRNGQLVEGAVEAVAPEVVANLLSEKDLVVIDIKKKDSHSGVELNFSFFKKVKSRDLVIFFRQLSVMIKANLPIVRVLNILVRQTSNKYLKFVIAGVADEVEGGAKLSSSLGNYPDVFSDFQSNIIRSGETSGRLSEVLEYLADQQEKDYDLQNQVKGATIYPAFILGGLGLVGFIIMTFVVPQITEVLNEAGVTLPWTTQMLILTSNFLRFYWYLIIIFIILLVGGSIFYVKGTYSGRSLFDSMKLRLPVLGSIFKKVYIIRMSRSFSTLLKGGVPVAQALEVVRDVMGNAVYRRIIEDVIADVDEGNTVAEGLAKHKEMPIMVSQMISVGEETGRLEEILERITAFYSREVAVSFSNLSTLIEPIVIVVLGVAVGVFVAAVLMPMWQLSSVL